MPALACTALLVATSAAAQRGVVIDVTSQENSLGACSNSAAAGCKLLTLNGLSTFVPFIEISPNGAITFGPANSRSTFSVAQSDVNYQIVSGWTKPSIVRTEYISFYAPGRDINVLTADNRPAPNFQIQFEQTGSGRPDGGGGTIYDLLITFAYRDPSSGGSLIPAGATIGYNSDSLGIGTIPGMDGSFGGFPANRTITTSDGLLLGNQPGFSQFQFVISALLDQRTRESTLVLNSSTFDPRFAAAGAVPEPGTWLLLLAGFGMVGTALRRRRRQPVLRDA
jgi:hypothetical protein